MFSLTFRNPPNQYDEGNAWSYMGYYLINNGKNDQML